MALDPTPDPARALDRMYALPQEEERCGYLRGRLARHESHVGTRLTSAEYRSLLDRNYRRAGALVYRPACAGCDACRQLRVLVQEFAPGESQRRCLRRNADVTVRAGAPRLDSEKETLYARYVAARHAGGPQSGSAEELSRFLYLSCVPTMELEYRDAEGRLLAASIVDVGNDYASSVYCYFDPDANKRSLGIFTALVEIGWTKQRGGRFYYLGYHVSGCAAMEYKASFLPHERRVAGAWVRFTRESRESGEN
jgi:arginyl-tRNA--protein-N-Asp/Glu arginylyltransferase